MPTKIPFEGLFRVTGAFLQQTGYWSPSNPHKGIDMVGESSKNIFGTCIGKVIYAGYKKDGYGNFVEIEDSNNKAFGLYPYCHGFMHLDSINVNVGDNVNYSTRLGVMGATGNVTGAHLHYEIRYYKPDGAFRDTVTGKRYELVSPADYMGIPNKIGTYNSADYIFDEQAPELTFKYKVGDKVRYTSYYTSPDITERAIPPAIACDDIGVIEEVCDKPQPYRIGNRYLNDGDIAELNPINYKYKQGQNVVFSSYYNSADETKRAIPPAIAQNGNGIIIMVQNKPQPYKIDFNNKTIYCNDGDILGLYTSPSVVYLTVSTKNSDLALNQGYNGVTATKPIIAWMPKGSIVELIKYVDKTWAQIKYAGKIGYSAREYLK